MKCLCLIVVAALCGGLLVSACSDQQKPEDQNQGPPTANQATNKVSPQPSESPAVTAKVDPEQLIATIKQLQRDYVQDSTGIEAGECFTDDDLNQFKNQKKPAEIVERLQRDNDYKSLVQTVKQMDASKRTDLLDKALNTYRRNWSELHLNPKTAAADELRKGQTVAGSKAEKLIAETVVDLVRRMI